MMNLPFNHVKEGAKVSRLELRGSLTQTTKDVATGRKFLPTLHCFYVPGRVGRVESTGD